MSVAPAAAAEGVDSGRGFRPLMMMGEMTGIFEWVVVMPQSSRSGRLSSSSPAQSMWLPGVEGRFSAMATALTLSTRASMSLFRLTEVTGVRGFVGTRCGGGSLTGAV